MTEETKTEITLGAYTLSAPNEKAQRISMLLWGSAGCGKTTLASTAPGKKLWINFDPDGTASIANRAKARNDIIVLDLSAEKDNIVEAFKKSDTTLIKNIEKVLTENPDIETVVLDSVTSFGDKALSHGVYAAQSTSKGKGATLEDPGFAGYGNKNTWTRLLVKHLLEVTGKLNRHMIFIAHEDKPEKNDQGAVLFITIMLGSSLSEQVPLQISEVWAMTDTGKERRIAVRPCRSRKPMKTRMFIANSSEPEFKWNYDADKLEGEGIADWYAAWKENGFSKLQLPK